MRISSTVVPFLLAATTVLTAQQDEADFASLFDGKTLTGWTGDVEGYRVEDGMIVCLAFQGDMERRANLLTVKEYSDFVLRFEFRMTPGANSGLAVRSPLKAAGTLHLEGIEIQIIDNSAERFQDLKDYQITGAVYGVVPAKRGALKPAGEWNEQEVIVNGRRITVVLNGTTIVDADVDEASKDGTLDGAEHPGLKRARGHIGFLGHDDRIEFRKIRIKEL